MTTVARRLPSFVTPKGKPKTWTQEEQLQIARQIAKHFTLAEMRKRQSIINQQHERAYQTAMSSVSQRSQMEDAMADLRVMAEVERLAVDIQTFGDRYEPAPG